jgi:hypothetical protein
VAVAAFSLCVVQVVFFYDPWDPAWFLTVDQIGTAALKRRMLNGWVKDYIAFPACCTIPFAVLLALVSFYNGQSHRRLSQNALTVSIILALIAALFLLNQVAWP